METKLRVTSFFLLSLFSLLLACDSSKEVKLQEMKVGYLQLASSLPLFVALEKGYFQEEGLKIEPIGLKSSNEVGNALTAGRIDASSITALSVWMAIKQHEKDLFKIFLMTCAQENTTVHRILARNGTDIHSLSDLTGKTIGTFPGLQMQVFTKLIFDNYFDTSSLQIVSLSPPLQKDALASGRIDALFCLEPVGTIVEDAGVGYQIAVNPLYQYVLKPFPTAASVISTDYIENHSDAARKYVRAINRAVDYLEANPVEARKILPQYTSLGVEIAQKVGIYDFWKVNEIDRNAVEKLAELYTQHNILEEKVNTLDMYLE